MIANIIKQKTWAKVLVCIVGVAISILFLHLWGSLLLLSLGIDSPSTVGTVLTILKEGFFLPPLITLMYLLAPIIAIGCYFHGREYRLVSRYIILNWIGTLVAASLAIKIFSSWKEIPISIAPWNAIDLFYELDNRSVLFHHWLVCFIVTLIPAVGLNIIDKIGFGKKIKEAFGDAHFASSSEISKAGGFGKKGIVVGKAYGRTIRLPGMESALLAASTGSGKTSSIAIPNLLDYDGSTIVNDIKGELYNLTANYRQQHFKAKCYCFNPMDDETKDFFNPFFYVSESCDKRIDDLFVIAQALVPETKLGEGFWYQSSRELFMLTSLFLIEARGAATLAEVYDLSKEQDLAAYILGGIEDSNISPSKQLLQNLIAFKNTDDKTRSNILKDFQSRLVMMMSPSIRKATSKNSFDLRKLREEKMSVYLSIPTGFQELLAPLLTVFWTQVTQLMTTHEPNLQKEPYSVLCLLDEFGMMERMNRIKDGLSFLRSYRVQFVVIVQYLSQIISKYGRDDAKSFFNAKTKIIFTPSDFDDAKMLSAALGTRAVKMQSKSINSGTMESSGHMTTNYQYQSKPLMRPDELMKMKLSKAIVMIEGQSPIKLKKIYWFKNRNYKEAIRSANE
mgnify:CR=1 FL=1|jgi:type IV secretion system protein VirD4